METVILVGCGKSKRNEPSPARDLYTGNLFRAARAYAEREVAAGRAVGWAVVSGLHRVVQPDRVLAPYDFKLSDKPASDDPLWGRVCINQCHGMTPTAKRLRIVVLAGAPYVQQILDNIMSHEIGTVEVVAPLAGLQVGERLRWFNQQAQQSNQQEEPMGNRAAEREKVLQKVRSERDKYIRRLVDAEKELEDAKRQARRDHQERERLQEQVKRYGCHAKALEVDAAAYRCLSTSPRFQEMTVREALEELAANGMSRPRCRIDGEPLEPGAHPDDLCAGCQQAAADLTSESSLVAAGLAGGKAA